MATLNPVAQMAQDEVGIEAVRNLLRLINEDPNRDGLKDTPRRVLAMYRELTAGYEMNPADLLTRTFEETSDELIVLDGIEFTSLCEHHLLPFIGTATIGYIPRDRVVGISKLARLVDCYARRLQVQERMTRQIAEAMMAHLKPEGCGVVLVAHHSCMGCRGVRKPEARMITSALHGVLRDKPEARSEFLALARMNGRAS